MKLEEKVSALVQQVKNLGDRLNLLIDRVGSHSERIQTLERQIAALGDRLNIERSRVGALGEQIRERDERYRSLAQRFIEIESVVLTEVANSD